MKHTDPQTLLECALADVRARDPGLARELDERRARHEGWHGLESLTAKMEGLGEDPRALGEAAYEYRIARPVMTVRNNRLAPPEPDREGMLWHERLEAAGENVLRAIRAVGRIEVEGHSDRQWFGTGFLVRNDIIVTNQHVAKEFAQARDAGFGFRFHWGKQMGVSLDFLEEDGNSASLVYPIDKVEYMEVDRSPDLAFLHVDRSGALDFPEPLVLAAGEAQPGQMVAAIGYPWHESRFMYADLMLSTFGNVHDKKRVAPGIVSGIRDGQVLHDCSVLGGNSGSPLIDLATGAVVGVHHTGEFMRENRAVPASEVEALLRNVGYGAPAQDLAPPAPRERITVFVPSRDGSNGNGNGYGNGHGNGSVVRIQIPLEVEIGLGGHL